MHHGCEVLLADLLREFTSCLCWILTSLNDASHNFNKSMQLTKQLIIQRQTYTKSHFPYKGFVTVWCLSPSDLQPCTSLWCISPSDLQTRTSLWCLSPSDLHTRTSLWCLSPSDLLKYLQTRTGLWHLSPSDLLQ